MFTKLKIVSAVVIATVTILVQPVHADAPIDSYINWDFLSVPQIIDRVAPLYEQDSTLITTIVRMESSFNCNSVHDHGQGKGCAGFHKDTFVRYDKQYFKKYGEHLDYNSTLDQMKLMSFTFSLGETSRKEWSTYRHLKGV